MRRVYVRLNESAIDVLVRLAETERRHPAAQAGLMLERALSQPNGEQSNLTMSSGTDKRKAA
jgi:hypothetical protein